jgi:hypothetical protein
VRAEPTRPKRPSRARPHPSGAPPAPAPAPAPTPPLKRLARSITCKAYLKRLNITQPMAETLLPAFQLATAPRAGSCAAAAATAAGGDEGGTRHYEQLFKAEIKLIDEAGHE